MPKLIAIAKVTRKHPATPNPIEITQRISSDVTATRLQLREQTIPPGRVWDETNTATANELIAMGAARVPTAAELAADPGVQP